VVRSTTRPVSEFKTQVESVVVADCPVDKETIGRPVWGS